MKLDLAASRIVDRFGRSISRARNASNGLIKIGEFHVVCRDASGHIKWRAEAPNLVVNVGLTNSLEVHLGGGAQSATWYLGLTDGTPTVAATDTMASHAGWVEVQGYDEAARPTAVFGVAAAQQITNSGNLARFTMNTTGTAGGAFLVDNSTKGGATGTLYSVGAFTEGDTPFSASDTIDVQYTGTAAAA